VPPRATTDVLLRLRQVEERDAMRGLDRARQALDRATETRDDAIAARAELAMRMQREGTSRGPTTAGALVTREAYRSQLRIQVAASDERLRAGERALREALQALTEAQQRVEQALRARQAAQKQRAAEDKAQARRRERQDQAATDDRWRPPRR
jgi:hypothetical protein